MARKSIDVYDVGIKVKIGVGEKIEGIIVGVAIYPHSVRYEVAWWNGRDRQEKWLDSSEVEPKE